jgi:hypothetical protein
LENSSTYDAEEAEAELINLKARREQFAEGREY